MDTKDIVQTSSRRNGSRVQALQTGKHRKKKRIFQQNQIRFQQQFDCELDQPQRIYLFYLYQRTKHVSGIYENFF